jgi:hypothetical protein
VTTPKLTVLLAAAALACHESLSPADYSGTYSLRTVNGTTVPAAAPTVPSGCTVGFQSASLALANGVFSMDGSVSFGCPGTGLAYTTPTWHTIAGAVETSGGRITLRAFDPMGGGTMDLGFAFAGSDAVVTFPAGAITLASATTLIFSPK